MTDRSIDAHNGQSDGGFPSETRQLRTVGIMLAGGLSRRYGSPKAFAEYEGRLFHERACEALAGACDPVVVAASEALASRFPAAYTICTDLPEMKGLGPLAGICSVMMRYPAGRYMVLPCDMPRIGPKEIMRLGDLARLHEEADVIAVHTEAGDDLPLLSVWRGGLEEQLRENISSGRLGVMKLLGKLDTVWLKARYIHADPERFHNFNVPQR